MRTTSSSTANTPQIQARRATMASLVGTSIEWYEFFIYGTAAALYFGPLFFPGGDPAVGRLLAFASFGVAFIARPLGAIVFGHLGDRIGRRATLIVTLSLMGGATGLIGLLPTYAQVGVLAPTLLVTMRFLQGLAVGGEWGGAVLMSVENAPPGKVRLYGSAPQMGSPIGLITATGVMALVGLMPQADRIAWGWRLPFLFGFVLVIIGLLIRLGVEESKSFVKIKERHDQPKVPLGQLFRYAKLPMVIGVGLQASVNVVFYIVATYFVSYAVNVLKMAQGTALLIVMLAAVVDVIALPLLASLADKVGVARIFGAGAVAAVIMGFPFFWGVNSGNPVLIFVSIAVGLVIAHATTYSVLSSMIAELYPVHFRYSGTAVTYAVAALVWSAPTPIIAEALVSGTGRWETLVAMMAVAGIFSLLSLYGYRRIAHRRNILGYEEAKTMERGTPENVY